MTFLFSQLSRSLTQTHREAGFWKWMITEFSGKLTDLTSRITNPLRSGWMHVSFKDQSRRFCVHTAAACEAHCEEEISSKS